MKKFINKLAEKIYNFTFDDESGAAPSPSVEEDKYIGLLKNDNAFFKVKREAEDDYGAYVNRIIKAERSHPNYIATTKQLALAGRTNSFVGGGNTGGNGFGQLMNPVAGIGSGGDFSSFDYRTTPGYTFQEVWTTFYQTSPIAKGIIDLLTQSVMRFSFESWININIKKGRQKEKQKKEEDFFDFIDRKQVYLTFYAAVRQMFMHGGAALYIDTDDVDLEIPLVMKKGKRIAFRLVDKSLMFPAGFNHIYDISSKTFNHPSHWSVIFFPGGTGLPIHESRFIFFVPEELPFFARINQLWWGNSSLLSIRQYINIVDRGFHSTGNQIQQASMAFLKTRIRSRATNPSVISRASQTKNTQFQNALNQNGNANVLDKDDEIARLEITNLKQQAEVAEKVINFGCAAHGIPPAVFYGSGAGGNHASDPELLNWHNRIRGNQSNYLRRPLDEMIYVISMSLWGESDVIKYKFSDLIEPTEQQKADISLKLMQEYAIAKKIGVPNDLLVKQMQRDGLFEDLTLEEVDATIAKMNSFDSKMMVSAGPSMEGKDIKDGLNKQNKPSDAIKGVEPESIVSQALYK